MVKSLIMKDEIDIHIWESSTVVVQLPYMQSVTSSNLVFPTQAGNA